MKDYNISRLARVFVFSLLVVGSLACSIQSLANNAEFVAARDLLGDILPPGAISRCGTPRMRQETAGVTSLAYVADGKLLATFARSEVRLFRSATGEPWDPAVIKDCALLACSPNGQWMAIGPYGASRTGENLSLRDLVKGTEYGLNTQQQIAALAFSGDGNTLVCGGLVGGLVVVDVKNHTVKARLEPNGGFSVVALSPDGKFVAAARHEHLVSKGEKEILVWEVSSRKIVAHLKGHMATVWSLAFVQGGKALVSAANDDTVRLWEMSTWREKGILSTSAYIVVGAPNGKLFATCRPKGNVVKFWDPESRKQTGELETRGAAIDAIAFSPDSTRLATGGDSYTVRQWDIATHKEIVALPGHAENVVTVVFSPDSERVASRCNGKTIRFWEAATGKEQRQLILGELRHFTTSGPYCLAFTPDWTKLAVIGPKTSPPLGQFDPTSQVFDVKTGTTLFTIVEPAGRPGAAQVPTNALAISTDGRTLASSYRGVRLFSLDSGQELPMHLGVQNFHTLCSVFSPDGRTLAAGLSTPNGVNNLEIWDWKTGQFVRSLLSHKRKVVALGFSPSGQLLATCGGMGTNEGLLDPEIRLWEVSTGGLVRAMKGHEGAISCVVVSPNGRLVASCGAEDKTVRIWDFFTGKELAKFTGHTGSVNTLAFSPNGKMLASGSSDTTILVWDVSGVRPQPLPAPAAEKLPELWTSLREREAAKAFAALHEMAGGGDKSVSFLTKVLSSVPAPEPAKLQSLIVKLDDEDPKVRDQAYATLAEFGWTAEPAMTQALSGEVSLEVRTRLTKLLEELPTHKIAEDELRMTRALLVLEVIGTDAAKELLAKLATGAPGSPATKGAKGALERLRRREAKR